MKKQNLILILFIFGSILTSCGSKKEQLKKDNNRVAENKVTESKPEEERTQPIQALEIPEGADGQVIEYEAFTISYNEKYEQANWVAYHLTKEEVEDHKVERKDNFRADKQVETGSATPTDYKKSGYDRGHLAPAADMRWSKEAMSESFYMTNMSPQTKELNRGIWKKLEEKSRDWAVENGSIYIVTAGILKGKLKTIGKNEVAIPEYYYKVILDYQEPEIKAIAFIMPNKDPEKAPLRDFVVSIDEVEKKTGLDFFPKLGDKLEDKLEGAKNPEKWGL